MKRIGIIGAGYIGRIAATEICSPMIPHEKIQGTEEAGTFIIKELPKAAPMHFDETSFNYKKHVQTCAKNRKKRKSKKKGKR